MLLENQIISGMCSNVEAVKATGVIDETVYKMFTEKFNDKYDAELLEEQKELLKLYVSSFSDNALELKIFLNEELARLKKELKAAKIVEEIMTDQEMLNKTSKIIQKLESYSKQPLNDEVLLTIMKTQSLVKEINSDANHS